MKTEEYNYTFLFLYCRYVDVILQLIDKAGDFVSDDIWFRVVQFVTNNEDLQVIETLFHVRNSQWDFSGLLINFYSSDLCTHFFVFCQPYAALKAREYLDKPAIHETMVKVCFLNHDFWIIMGPSRIYDS